MKSAVSLTRRSFLGLAALGLAGCKGASPPAARHLDPDASALAAARDAEVALLAATTDPAQREAHVAHLAALGGSAPGAATAIGPSARSLLRSSTTSLRAAALTATSGTHAAVFASIAASHEVLARD
ncbi:MAG TPA: hypothetical protein VHE57_07010 [Mycobacteriales bacterium]|nr:hypothetical protein [Mycobacteriales bacterium]